MNTKLLSLILGLAVLGSLTSFYLSRPHGSQAPKFVIGDFKPYSHLDLDELRYRISLFNDWIEEHQKQYSAEEAAIRFYAWNKNYDAVQEHNSKNYTWTLAMNLFADLSSEEFAALHLGYLGDQTNQETENVEVETTETSDEGLLGDSWDWRTKGAVTSVKNQGSCGGCYAFASVHALEGLGFISNKGLMELSPQQIIDCSGSYGNQGCNGGLMTYSYSYTWKNGISLNSTYPYQGKLGSCKTATSAFNHTGYISVVTGAGAALKAAVKYQPVSVAVEADKTVFQLYKSGVITGSTCGTSLNHAITAVGYGTTNNIDHWIVKNQWGTSWGLQGYVYIGYNSTTNGVCGINMQASFPALVVAHNNENNKKNINQ